MVENSDYEKQQINNIILWKGESPGIIGAALSTVLEPALWLFNKIVPPSLIEALLSAADWMADATVNGELSEVSKGQTLEQLDTEADSVQNWAIGYAVAEGGVAGAFGFLSLPADIPALITLSLRTIRRVGICYGYDGKGEEEKQFVLGVLAAAGANTIQEKATAILTLQTLQVTLLKTTWKKMAETAAGNAFGKEAALIFLRDVAEQLGINLTKRKALAAIPIVGAAVGGGLNGWYLRDIGLAAQRSYQERWLRDQGRWIDADYQEKTG